MEPVGRTDARPDLLLRRHPDVEQARHVHPPDREDAHLVASAKGHPTVTPGRLAGGQVDPVLLGDEGRRDRRVRSLHLGPEASPVRRRLDLSAQTPRDLAQPESRCHA
jgi:hypothetical protein